jgi:hypothetical protein
MWLHSADGPRLTLSMPADPGPAPRPQRHLDHLHTAYTRGLYLQLTYSHCTCIPMLLYGRWRNFRTLQPRVSGMYLRRAKRAGVGAASCLPFALEETTRTDRESESSRFAHSSSLHRERVVERLPLEERVTVRSFQRRVPMKMRSPDPLWVRRSRCSLIPSAESSVALALAVAPAPAPPSRRRLFPPVSTFSFSPSRYYGVGRESATP